MKVFTHIFTILLIFISFNSFAQSPFHIGIKAGANFTDMSNNLKDYNSKSATGYGAGIMMRLDIKKAYIQADFMYSEKNVDFTPTTTLLSEESVKMKNFEIPLVLGYKIVDAKVFNLRAFAGGVYTSVEEAKLTTKDVEGVFKNFDSSNIGYRLGMGVDILSFTLDVSYDGSLNDINKDFKSKPNTWFVAVGFKFI